MDIRNARVEPIIEHGGTCLSYLMFPKESLRSDTMGSYLELVAEFELKDGAKLEPHHHDSDEFYYILSGDATIQIESEVREITMGDLVRIPRNAVHSIWPTDPNGTFRAFAFAVSYQPDGATYAPAELPEPSPA
jgi:mannose-6-phosphate isomerase-like protein (cupin superfamily)